MDNITFSAAWGAVGIAIVISIYVAQRRRWRRKRLQIVELLGRYFRGEMPADKLGQRVREIASRRFISSGEFYALAIGAFQLATDHNLSRPAHSRDDESKMMNLLAALKNEFGLTDLYQMEVERPVRV